MDRTKRSSGVSGRLGGLAVVLWVCVPLGCSDSKPLGRSGTGGAPGTGGSVVTRSAGGSGGFDPASSTGGSVGPSSGGAAGGGIKGTGGTAGMGSGGVRQGDAGVDAAGSDSPIDSSIIDSPIEGRGCSPIDVHCSLGSVLDPSGCVVCFRSESDIDGGAQGSGGSTGDVRAPGGTGGMGGSSTKNGGAGGTSSKNDAGVTGVPCGRVVCAANQECCNPLCDMCVPPGGGCGMGCGEWGSLDVIGPTP